MVILKNAARLNSLTSLVITKLDVLDDLNELKICTGYEYNGKIIKDFPSSIKILENCTPVYETHPGWMQDTSKLTDYDQLPENAKKYLSRIEELSGVSIFIVSVGLEGMPLFLKKNSMSKKFNDDLKFYIFN